MTCDEVLARLRETRAEFDRLVAAIPAERLTVPVPGGAHSPKDLVFHVTAYEDLIVQRLRCARTGELTEFDRDRDSYEAFNARIWAEAATTTVPSTRAQAARTFLNLLEEIGHLSDEELNGNAGITKGIDHAWLQDRTLAETIGVDGFEHYPMHYAGLAAAGGSAGADSGEGDA